MLLTVSTVKDSVAELERFVARNLANGVDHMLLFIDDSDRDVTAAMNRHPHVTAVATGSNWWHKRPRQLNNRQRINANIARTLLAPFEWAEWLFHIDGDECLQVDRAALRDLPADVGVVRAPPLEAVSRRKWPRGRVTHFKRLLERDELVLLEVLGVIDESSNNRYFHGHCEGKSGMRPVMDRWIALHAVHDAQEQPVASDIAGNGVARLLHYESWSGQEFVRKWLNLLSAGTEPGLRPARARTAVALRTLVARDLPKKRLNAYLMRIFERTTEDDFGTLLDLGMLEQIDPMAGTHTPEQLTVDARAALDALIGVVEPEAKRAFRTGRTASAMIETLHRSAARLEERGYDAALVARVRETWTLPDDLTRKSHTPDAGADRAEGQGSE